MENDISYRLLRDFVGVNSITLYGAVKHFCFMIFVDSKIGRVLCKFMYATFDLCVKMRWFQL